MYEKLNKSFVEKVDLPVKGQKFYRDTELKGFALRVTPGAKTYIVETWISSKGKSCRYTVGKHGKVKHEWARQKAEEILHMTAAGIDPLELKRKERRLHEERALVTLRAAWESYKANRNLRDTTIKIYETALRLCFSDWLDQPITQITKDDIARRHSKLLVRQGPRSDKDGAKAHANQAMRSLRAILNYAKNTYEDEEGKPLLSENPVSRLSQARLWQPVRRRKEHIKRHQLPRWFKSVMKLENLVIRDYLLLCLFTGLRRSEAAGLRWDEIDVDAKTLRIPAERAKNHQEHVLPLSDFLCKLLSQRIRVVGSPFVFPGKGRDGHLVDPKKMIQKVAADSEVQFRSHDLRRTFISIAEGCDISHYTLQRLLNHRSKDVTSSYIQFEEERLREPMQKITDAILGFFEVEKNEFLHRERFNKAL